MKKKLTIYVKEEITEKAKDIGLNISRICENALKEAIRRLEGSDVSNNGGEDLKHLESKENWWAGQDLNLRPSARKADVLAGLDYRPHCRKL